MSDETPQADDTPIVPSTPAEPASPTAPTPEAPVAQTPVAPTPVADTPTVETPTAPAAPVAAAAAPAPAPTAAAPPPEHRSGFFVPKWLAIVAGAIVAALVFGGIGYAIGDSNGGDSNSQNASSLPGIGSGNQNGGRVFPGLGNGLGNQGNGNSNGSSGNGGTSNGNGSGSGQTTSTAFLGVGVDPQSTNGATVTAVKSGSPADDAGLKTGDVITKVDDTSIDSATALVQAVHSHSSGDQVTVTYTRGGNSATAKVTLGSNTTSQSS